MLCQQSNAGEMVPFTLREQADGVGVVLEGVFSDSPETQPSDNTLQQSHSSRRWDTLLKLYIQKRIWKSEKNNDRRQTADPQNIIVFDKNKVVRIGCECETVNSLKKREGGREGGSQAHCPGKQIGNGSFEDRGCAFPSFNCSLIPTIPVGLPTPNLCFTLQIYQYPSNTKNVLYSRTSA